MKRLFLCVGLLLAGCEGVAGEPDGGATTQDAGPFDAGPQPIKYTRYTLRSEGWPANARVRGAAVLDNVLFVATDQGLLSLRATDTRWLPVTTPLMGDVKPTSLDRFDQSLVMTAAGAAGGGLYVKTLDADWAQVTTAPSTASWTIVKKSSEWLLVTTGGLYKATALAGPWARRSALNTPLFAMPVTRFVAAPAQQKLFGAGSTGGLFESSDVGATWTASALRGTVEAIAAQGAFVLVSTSMDGQQRSDNYGNTFRPATTPISSGVLTYVADGPRFWAAGNGGLLSSEDDGVTFTANSGGLPAGTAVLGLFFAGSYALAETTAGPYLTQP